MNQPLKIKVCGMKFPENRKNLEALPVNYFGFIFFPNSKRYVGNMRDTDFFELVDTHLEKVGVFVDETIENIIEISEKASLSHIQLHGEESPEFCAKIKTKGYKIIKAFRIDAGFDFSRTKKYVTAADYFLFDTKGGTHGGTGRKFDWEMLENYKGSKPFFLSGGIGSEDAGSINSLAHPLLYGVDLNSGFEDYPGMKNITKIRRFLEELENTK